MKGKKVLGFILTAAMILSSFSAAFAAEETGADADETSTTAEETSTDAEETSIDVGETDATAVSSFSDTGGHWAAPAAEKWADYGVLNGSDGKFRPDDYITRAEMATVLDNLMDYQATAVNVFPDVPAGAWYEDAVLKANAAGVLNGDGAGHADPTADITREQAALMLARALTVDDGQETSTKFSDAGSISSWAKPLVFGMEAAGYISGYNNRFDPQDNITRAEVVTIINNAVKTYYTTAGTYTDDVDGLAVIKTADVIIKDAVISGNLIIAEGVASGTASIDGADVGGRLVVRSGAAVTVRGDVDRLDLEAGGTADIQSGIVTELNIPAGASAGIASGAEVKTVNLTGAAEITGGGKIETANISGTGGVIEQKPGKVVLADGASATVNGKLMESEAAPPESGGSDSGSGNSSSGGDGDGSGNRSDRGGNDNDSDSDGGADPDNAAYWPSNDYYNAASSDTLTMLTGYGTLQTAEGGGGPASVLSVLDWYDKRGGLNEEDLSGLIQTGEDGFTSLAAITGIFEDPDELGISGEWDLFSSADDPDKLFDSAWIRETLASGRPVIVGENSFGAHYQVIIGYDTMGTENTNDDVLILMDPYDTTDHSNDGYSIRSYERLAWGVGFEDGYNHTSFLVAAPKDWNYAGPVTGEGIPDDPSNTGIFTDDHKIPYGDAAADIQAYYPDTQNPGDNGLAGPAAGGYERSGDHDNSPYYEFFDIYNTASDTSLIALSKFRTAQQVTEWTCGPSSALMVLDWFDMNSGQLTELDLARLRQGGEAGATTVNGMEEIFQSLNNDDDYTDGDWAWFTMRDLEEDDNGQKIGGYYLEKGKNDGGLIPYLLSKGVPVAIGWDEWSGHWQVAIGYDDMSTDDARDDVLILADPYDTTDHNQDGYVLESFERLIRGWDSRSGEDYAFIAAFPESRYEDVIEELGLEEPYFTAAE